jgi:hypothetical protein
MYLTTTAKYLKQNPTQLKEKYTMKQEWLENSITLSVMDRARRQRAKKKIEDLKNTINHLPLRAIYGTPHSASEHTFYSTGGMLSRIDCTVGHKTMLKFRKIEIHCVS